MALIYNASFDSTTRVLSLLDKAGNVISSCEVPSKELVDDITKPLTFKATQGGSTVKLEQYYPPDGAFQTSSDGGSTWEDYKINTDITLNIGDEVSFRAKADRTSAQDTQTYFYFRMTGKIEAWHNVMSMYRTSDFATYESVVKYAFYRMFKDCKSLTKAPVLPATTLADNCYERIFEGCTSLTEAPELPATTLANYCYYWMFYGCTSLTKSPVLSATTLAYRCCDDMFYDCSSLNEVRCKIPSSYSSSDMPTYTGSWLTNVSSTGTFYTNADANWPSGESGIPTGWNRVNEIAKDDLSKPLTFKATQDGSTVKLTKYGSPTGGFQTSRDGGNTWSDYTLDSAITLNTGGEVSFRAKSDRTSGQYIQHYFYFKMTGKIEAWHNVMSLYRTNDFSTYGSVAADGFIYMFKGCTSLTKAPVLPATTLADSCYQFMFYGCTSLTEAPELPVTTLAPKCYSSMFKGCTSLTKAPELPATTLAQNCYQSMFEGCTSLKKAPALSATTLSSSCYEYMFKGCSRLNEVRCNIPSSYSSSDISLYAVDWLLNVSETGTFYTSADVNWPSGASGIPENWNRVNERAKDDLSKPLTFRATQDGSTVKLTRVGFPSSSFQTSSDGGKNWADYTIDTVITLNTSDEVSFRAKSDRTSEQKNQSYFYFEMTGKIEAWHNVMSLYRTNDFSTYESVVRCAFYNLFNRCTSLTKAPALPATTLAIDCYKSMFYGCTSLTKSPALPETTFAPYCYDRMFSGCSSLNEVRCKMSSSYSSSAISSDASYWLLNVSSTGTFYTNADANWPSGESGIPEGWTRLNIDDYPTT